MKRRSIRSTVRALLLPLAYLLAACGSPATGSLPPTPGPLARDTPIAAPTPPAQPTVAAAPSPLPTAVIAPSPQAAPTATTPAAEADLLISYHKSGGIAGVNETLTVYTNGKVELRTRSATSTAQADPSALAALRKLLDSPEFAALQVPVHPPVADQFVYELTVPGHAKPIVATDGAENPPVLSDLLVALEQLKRQAK